MDEEISWSEPPRRRRRVVSDEPIRARRRTSGAPYEASRQRRSEAEFGLSRELPDWQQDPLGAALEEETVSRIEHAQARVTPRRERAARRDRQPAARRDRQPAARRDRQPAARRDRQPRTERRSSARPFDLSDLGAPDAGLGARRTVLITGHGDERYIPALTRRRTAELRFHERLTFSPDRAGLWAVLLGIALVIGAIAH